MAGKKGDLAIIGDRDSVLLAKAVGLAVFDETDPEKASRLIHRLAREEYKVIFLTEPLFAACGEAVAQYKSETFPCEGIYPFCAGLEPLRRASSNRGAFQPPVL